MLYVLSWSHLTFSTTISLILWSLWSVYQKVLPLGIKTRIIYIPEEEDLSKSHFSLNHNPDELSYLQENSHGQIFTMTLWTTILNISKTLPAFIIPPSTLFILYAMAYHTNFINDASVLSIISFATLTCTSSLLLLDAVLYTLKTILDIIRAWIRPIDILCTWFSGLLEPMVRWIKGFPTPGERGNECMAIRTQCSGVQFGGGVQCRRMSSWVSVHRSEARNWVWFCPEHIEGVRGSEVGRVDGGGWWCLGADRWNTL